MTTDEKVREGVEHLQAAALEMIAAARSFLDAAEDLVRDPSVALAMAAAAADRAGRRTPGPVASEEPAPRVQRIKVS